LRKLKGQTRINNPETEAKLRAQDTRRRQSKQKHITVYYKRHKTQDEDIQNTGAHEFIY
jgi:hypothetical protein